MRGVDVTCETCPHYLMFTDEDAERIGALAKCAPPLRDAEIRESLWDSLLQGEIDIIASDHSPAPPDMKEGYDYFRIWGGISGCQHLLPVILTAGLERGVTLPELARLVSTNVAQRFRLPGKGEIAPGFDADLAIVERREAGPVPRELVQYRHPHCAWDIVPVEHQVVFTIVRGEVVFGNGAIGRRPPSGRLIEGPFRHGGGQRNAPSVMVSR